MDLAEYHMSTPVGVPLAETVRIPGMATPVDGQLVPSDAPGFGMQIEPDWITSWDHSRPPEAGAVVL
jgi:hypothetical protein